MPERTVAVTGANGFVGSALLQTFADAGWQVIALTRRPLADLPIEWRRYDLLDDSLPAGLFAGVDVLVHCAYARRRPGLDAIATNVRASKLLFDAARATGTKQLIFVSSLAADEHALSEYGRQKFRIEQMLDPNADTVVRAGLVLGNGGLFARMQAYLRRRSLVPLIDGGRQPVQTVDVDDLSCCILKIAEQDLTGLFTIADYPGMTYEQFYRLLAASVHVPVRFVSLPFWVFDAGLRAAEVLRIPLPIDRDNLLGICTAEIRTTTPFSTFGVDPQTPAQAIERDRTLETGARNRRPED
jgi:NADH dehydrogenase